MYFGRSLSYECQCYFPWLRAAPIKFPNRFKSGRFGRDVAPDGFFVVVGGDGGDVSSSSSINSLILLCELSGGFGSDPLVSGHLYILLIFRTSSEENASLCPIFIEPYF